MEMLFQNLTTLLSDGIFPNLTLLSEWLMDEERGLFLGLIVIALPLLGRIINIFIKFIK